MLNAILNSINIETVISTTEYNLIILNIISDNLVHLGGNDGQA